MKKIIIYCIALFFTFITIFSASATDSINFRLSNAECDVNRLFEISVIASGYRSLSAVTFEFTYDKSMFEFRETNACDGSMVKSNELDNCVKAVYLCADGADISSGKTIFTITYKALKAGAGYIDFSVYECVNQDIEFADVGSCTSAKVTVNGNSSSNLSSSGKSNTSGNANSQDNSDNNKSAKSSRTEDTTSQATIDNLGIINSINDNKVKYIFLGCSIGIGIIIILAFVFLLGRKTSNIKKSNDNK